MVTAEIIGIIIAIAGLIPLYADFLKRQMQEGRIEFYLERFQEKVDKPVESNWSIRVLHPNKRIDRCNVTFDGVPLPWGDKNEAYYERIIQMSGGGNVRIPNTTMKGDAEVIIKNGDKKLRRVQFIDIPIAR